MPLEQSKVSCVLKGTPSLSLSGNHLGPHKFVDELLAEVTSKINCTAAESSSQLNIASSQANQERFSVNHL